MQGTATIRWRNNSPRTVYRLALDWSQSQDQSVTLTFQGNPVPILAGRRLPAPSSPLLLELPEALPPGEPVELHLDFSKTLPIQGDPDKLILTGWHPRLWWGFPTHDDFAVRIESPPGYAVAASGRLDPESGCYHAEGVRSFGLFLGKNLQVEEDPAGDVLVRCLLNFPTTQLR